MSNTTKNVYGRTTVTITETASGKFLWQAFRDFFGKGETSLEALIDSGIEDTREAAVEAGRKVEY